MNWYDFYTLDFEYDEAKSRANQRKHGIDFEGAQILWDDPDRVEIPARTVDEPRFMVVAKAGGKHWSAVITYRDRRRRIISVRRARKEEIAIYEG